jgi:tetratricopeptide (TPR) repeat protein
MSHPERVKGPADLAEDVKQTTDLAEDEEFYESNAGQSDVEELSQKVHDAVNLDDEYDNSCSDLPHVEKDIALANEAKEEGNSYFRSKDYDNAISSYSRAVNLCPVDDENKESLSVFLGNRAAAYFSVGEFDCVIDDCTASLELKPDYVKVLMRRSQAYEKLTRPEDALVGEIFYPYLFCWMSYFFIEGSTAFSPSVYFPGID